MGNPRLLVAYTLGVAIVIGAIISLATGSWWVLAFAVAVHLGASAFFLVYTFRRIEQGDKPDPVTEARLEEEQRAGKKNDGLTDSGRRGDHEVIL
jgi:membrane protein implicated in regulation of membrane protease activity